MTAKRPPSLENVQKFAVDPFGNAKLSFKPTPQEYFFILVESDDPYLANLTSKKIAKSLGGEVQRHHSEELSNAQSEAVIFETLTSRSIFSPQRTVIVSDLQKLKSATLAKFIGKLGDLSSSSHFIGTWINKDKKSVAPIINPYAIICSIPTITSVAIEKFIVSLLVENGHSGNICPEATKLCFTLYKDNLELLSNEVSKIALILPSDTQVSAKHILTYTSAKPEKSSFDLLNAIASRNRLLSLSLAKDILTQGMHPLQLLSFLTTAFKTLLISYNTNPAELSWYGKKLLQMKGALPLERCMKICNELASLELKLKGEGIDDDFEICNSISRL